MRKKKNKIRRKLKKHWKDCITLENIAIFSAIISIVLLSLGLYLLPSWIGSRIMIAGSIFLWIFIISAFFVAVR